MTKETKKKAPKKSKKAAIRKRIKRSKWCADCLRKGRRKKEAIRYEDGSRDSYCRTHKRERLRLYMKKRRSTDPTYGEPGPDRVRVRKQKIDEKKPKAKETKAAKTKKTA